jgi:hypothetical protein
MAISIELRVDGQVVNGIEMWWDDLDVALTGRDEEYPLLSRVDPYGDVVFGANVLDGVLAELEKLANSEPHLSNIAKIRALCIEGLSSEQSELRFSGD